MDVGSPSRLSIAKEAAYAVIDTLGNNDFVGLVLFSDDAFSPINFLLRASGLNKARLKNFVEDITTIGMTNFEASFK